MRRSEGIILTQGVHVRCVFDSFLDAGRLVIRQPPEPVPAAGLPLCSPRPSVVGARGGEGAQQATCEVAAARADPCRVDVIEQ